MRILVADQNALLLAAIAATFGRHCEIVTETRRDLCMAHVEQRHFDVVVACEKLAGYTGLELLSEVEAVSPATLRIFAAQPKTLKRLGKRLDFFGLLGTLHYPIEARKLLVALKVARTKLPGPPKSPQVKHVVLENEWDTGERLALLGQELDDAPDETPAYSDAGAANDQMFSDEPAAAQNGSRPSATPRQPSPATPERPATTQGTVKGPRPRKPTVPTAAQREAFQRALARRNAARASGMVETPPIDFSSMAPMSATRPVARPPAGSSKSLSDIARMATTKRPLPGTLRRGRATQPKRREGNPTKRYWRDVGHPKRRAFVVGSGIAAVLIVGFVCFELLRTTSSHKLGLHVRAASVQLFSPASTLVADNSASSPQVFSPPPPHTVATAPTSGTASSLPQPQTFDPDTAPPDPPPPPVLEHPGPMEPPSMAHNGPPLGMQGDSTDE